MNMALSNQLLDKISSDITANVHSQLDQIINEANIKADNLLKIAGIEVELEIRKKFNEQFKNVVIVAIIKKLGKNIMSIDALSSQIVRMIDDYLDVIIRDTNDISKQSKNDPVFNTEYKQAAYKAVIERLVKKLYDSHNDK